MLIQCSSCGTQARIPDSKEGAKVRCPSCGHVYLARPPGSRARPKQDPTKYFIVGGTIVVGLVVMVIANKALQSEDPIVAEEEPEEPPPVVDDTGWDSPAVQLVRGVHDHAHTRNKPALRAALEPAAHHAWLLERAAAEPDEPEEAEGAAAADAAAGGDEDLAAAPEGVDLSRPWEAMTIEQRNLFTTSVVDGMASRDPENLVASWRPFEGNVLSREDDRALVRVQVASREPTEAGFDRWLDWHLVDVSAAGSDERRWKVAGWERWISPAEEERIRRSRRGKTTKRTLSDGSFVIEGEIRAIPYEDDVPAEERERIDGLVASLMDLEARPGVRTDAHNALVEIGKPAIAPLLTKIAETVPLETEDDAIRMGLVHRALSEMTGYVTTYKPSVALGATEERMDSGLKQWFGWYDRKYRRFTEPVVGEDPLWDDPDWQPRTERERLEFERARRERERELERQGDGR